MRRSGSCPRASGRLTGLVRLLLALGLIAHAAAAVSYPSTVASGSDIITSSCLFAGTQSISLGTPAGLSAVLTPGTEFTILLRTCRAAAGSSGSLISLATPSAAEISIRSGGGVNDVGTIGGVSFTTGAGSIKNPTWDCIAMVNRNSSGTFMGRIMIDGNASEPETAVGATTVPSSTPIMIGARSGSSPGTISDGYSGNIAAIAIWNYALTDVQIHEAMGLLAPSDILYTTFDGTDFATGLVAYYPANDPLGTSTLHDCVQGLDGVCSGPGIFDATQYAHYPVICWGDSLTNAAGSQTGVGWQNQLVGGGGGFRQGRTIQSEGFSGMPVAYIASQMALPQMVQYKTWTYTFLVGQHDLGNTPTVLSFLTTQTSAMIHNRWIVLGNCMDGVGMGSGPSSLTGPQDWGTTSRSQMEDMNRREQQLVGARFCNLQIPTNAIAYLPAEANDVFQLRTPAHVVSTIGAPHPDDDGYICWSNAAGAFMTSMNPMW